MHASRSALDANKRPYEPEYLSARPANSDKRPRLRLFLKLAEDGPQVEIDGAEIRQLAMALLTSEKKRDALATMAKLGVQGSEGTGDHSFEDLIHALGKLMRSPPAAAPAAPVRQPRDTGLDIETLTKLIDEVVTEKLSRREIEVLRLVMNGDSNKQIARHLNIAEPTVKCHVKSVLRKLNARNRFEAAMWAMKLRFGENV